MVSVTLIGAEEVHKYLTDLPKKMNKEINSGTGQWIKGVQKGAKMRAPKRTGDLANSIKVKKQSKGWSLLVNSPYGQFQEEGFRGHFVNSSRSTRNSSGSIAQAYGIPEGVTLLIQAQKGRKFVEGALRAGIARLDSQLNKSADRGLR